MARSRANYRSFVRELLLDRPDVTLPSCPPGQVYSLCEPLGIREEELAAALADFVGWPYKGEVLPEEVSFDRFTERFCKSHHVLQLHAVGENAFALSNPFDLPLMQLLGRRQGETCTLYVAAPATIYAGLGLGPAGQPEELPDFSDTIDCSAVARTPDSIELSPVVALANRCLLLAVQARASDIHFEPKPEDLEVRVRVDGEMQDLLSLNKRDARMVISRMKSLAALDIAEKRKPQDGSFMALVDGKQYKMRLATTSTPHGESLIIRLLDATAKPRSLAECGMSELEAEKAVAAANRHSGLIMLVGPTGSGKTSTIYSLLHAVDFTSRSLMSVEDPVEYRIPFANQQQVNEKAGVTFESLLRSALRQDPDVLYLGEIRDAFSAKTAIDIVCTGHLCVTTLHAPDTTATIARLERLGVARQQFAEAGSLVVSQRLVRRPCKECKSVRPISPEELRMLAPYTTQPPTEVIEVRGCAACAEKGYKGREAVYEMLEFDPQVIERIRDGLPALELRRFMMQRGDCLFDLAAVRKIAELRVPVEEIYAKVLGDLDPLIGPKSVPSETATFPAMRVAPSAEAPEAGTSSNELPTFLSRETHSAFRQPAGGTPVEPTPSDPGAEAVERLDSLPVREPEGPAVSAPGPALTEDAAPLPGPHDSTRFRRTARVPVAPVKEAEETGPRVLVVDDDPVFREYIKMLLELDGKRVTMAGDGVEALMLLGQERFDLIVCDLEMPNIDGLSLLEFARKKNLGTPLLFTTANRDEDLEVRGLELGAEDFLHKPVNRKAFLLRVARILARSSG